MYNVQNKIFLSKRRLLHNFQYLLSDKEDEPNSIIQGAEICETIPYDIAVRFPTSIPRIIV